MLEPAKQLDPGLGAPAAGGAAALPGRGRSGRFGGSQRRHQPLGAKAVAAQRRPFCKQSQAGLPDRWVVPRDHLVNRASGTVSSAAKGLLGTAVNIAPLLPLFGRKGTTPAPLRSVESCPR